MNLIIYNIIGACCFMLLIIIVLTMMFIDYKKEKNEYNKGICPKCGGRLYICSFSVNGYRIYKCEKCNYITVISYKNVDGYNKKEK